MNQPHPFDNTNNISSTKTDCTSPESASEESRSDGPKAPPPRIRYQRRCSVTRYSLEAAAAVVKGGVESLRRSFTRMTSKKRPRRIPKPERRKNATIYFGLDSQAQYLLDVNPSIFNCRE